MYVYLCYFLYGHKYFVVIWYQCCISSVFMTPYGTGTFESTRQPCLHCLGWYRVFCEMKSEKLIGSSRAQIQFVEYFLFFALELVDDLPFLDVQETTCCSYNCRSECITYTVYTSPCLLTPTAVPVPPVFNVKWCGLMWSLYLWIYVWYTNTPG